MTKEDMENCRLQQKIDEYADMLFRLSYLRLGNRQDAEDVVQEVFYQYLRCGGEFQSGEHEKAWLLKVALNACRKVCRSAWRRHRADVCPDGILQEGQGRGWNLGVLGERFSGSPAGEFPGEGFLGETVPGPEESAVRQEEKRLLMKAVWALPEKYRDVIHLFYYEELSVKEIAQVTDRRESTVTSQLTRGRELLRKSLKEEYDFG